MWRHRRPQGSVTVDQDLGDGGASRGDKGVFQLGDIFKVNVMGTVDRSGARNGEKEKKKKNQG